MKFDLLLQHCADLGIDVEYEDLGSTRHGEYRHHSSKIVLNTRNTSAQMLAALGHEVGHAMYCHYGQTSNHQMADEAGAALIISVEEYAAAEEEVGPHAGALATQLEVTRRLVLAWRRWYVRTHAPLSVAADSVDE